MEEWELNQQKKEYLNRYKAAKGRERTICDQIQQLRLDTMFPRLRGDGLPTGSSQSDLSDYMAKYDDLIEELKQESLNAKKEYTEIQNAIRQMEDEEEKEVLTRKYIINQKWEKIAEEMGCSRMTVIRIHGRALKNFKIPKNGTP